MKDRVQDTPKAGANAKPNAALRKTQPAYADFESTLREDSKAFQTASDWQSKGCDLRHVWGWLQLFLTGGARPGDGRKLEEERRERKTQVEKGLRAAISGLERVLKHEPNEYLNGALELCREALGRTQKAFATKPFGVAHNYLPLAALEQYLARHCAVTQADLMRITAIGMKTFGWRADLTDVEAIRKGFEHFKRANPQGIMEKLKRLPPY